MKIDELKIIQKAKDFSLLLQQRIGKSNIEHFKRINFNSKVFRNSKIFDSYIDMIENSKVPIIYVIHVSNSETSTLLVSKFNEFHKINITRIKNKDRVNTSRFNGNVSKILYVGSSITNFKTRIKNHLGVMGSRVYSLHLAKWDQNIDYDVLIDVFKVNSSDGSILERFVVEIIEQQIWDELKPVFGKKSGL